MDPQQPSYTLPPGVPPTPPTQRRNPLVIIAIVVGGLLLLGIVACVGLFLLGSSPAVQEATVDSQQSNISRSNDAVKSGELNRLKVIRVDNEARLYVNDTLVYTSNDDKLPKGGVGFATSADGGDATVSVDNWQLWRLP